MHEPLNIEFSILKQRLARRLVAEGQTDQSVTNLDLVELTKVSNKCANAGLHGYMECWNRCLQSVPSSNCRLACGLGSCEIVGESEMPGSAYFESLTRV